MNSFNTHNIFPEYFLISVPLFKDIVNQEIDEWLYLLKYSEVKKSLKSLYVHKIAERLSILKIEIIPEENVCKYGGVLTLEESYKTHQRIEIPAIKPIITV